MGKGQGSKNGQNWLLIGSVAAVFLLIGMYVVPQIQLAVNKNASSKAIAEANAYFEVSDVSEAPQAQWIGVCLTVCNDDFSQNVNQYTVCREKCYEEAYGQEIDVEIIVPR